MTQDNLFVNWLRESNQYKASSQKKYFDNLQQPLVYIRTPQIHKLQHKFHDSKIDMHNHIEDTTEFSKSIFKKVITRENGEYIFGMDNLQMIGIPKQQRHNKQEVNQKTGQKIRTNKQIGQRQFKFQKIKINSDVPYVSGDLEKKPLTLKQIKLLQTQQFMDKCSQYEFYDVFVGTKNQQIGKCPSPIFRSSQNENLQKIMEKFKFSLLPQQNLISDKSKHVTFNPQRQLQFYKLFSGINEKDKQLNILGSCININIENPDNIAMLDFAAGFVDTELLSDLYLLKKQHKIKKKNEQSDENLQKKYNELKKRLDHYRQMKFQNKTRQVAKKYKRQITQTLNNLQQPIYQQYFATALNENLILLEELKKIRNQSIKQEDDQIRRTMLINVNEDIRQLLFYILLTIFDGEKSINYNQFIQIGDKIEAERKLLDLIHQKFHEFLRKQVDGRLKLDLLKIYIKQRKLCEESLQIIQQRWK